MSWIFHPLTAAWLVAAMSIASARAHEFWVEPAAGVVEPGQAIVADLKVGQMLRGESYPYLSDRFTRFAVTVGGATTAAAGNEGDIPALHDIAARPGLNIVAHQTVAFRVTYDDWAVFRKYLADEGLDRFADLHYARGLPETGFAERYIRYAKALVQAGPTIPGDRDAPLGLPFELVAEANPYSLGLDSLPVSLLWKGVPVAGQQITVFRDDGGTISRSKVATDSAGQAYIPIGDGGTFLLNSVRLEPVDSAPVSWQSHWASMTFSTVRNSK